MTFLYKNNRRPTNTTKTLYNAVVIGLGGVGSFALKALASSMKQRNQHHPDSSNNHHSKLLLGIEQFTRGHSFGSSHGESRIYRHAYFEHPGYVPLIRYSTSVFQAMQKRAGKEIIRECGTLIMEDGTGYYDNCDASIIRSCLKSAKVYGLDVELLSNQELQERFPQFSFCGKNDDIMGLLEHEGGFIRPEVAIECALAEAEEDGSQIWEESVVECIEEEEDRDRVKIILRNRPGDSGDSKVIYARNVIVAAGAWASRLIPQWKHLLRVTRQIQGWVDVSKVPKRSTLYGSENFATWLLSTSSLRQPFYGIPSTESDCREIKIALHGRDVSVDPNLRNPKVTKEEKEELECAFRTYFESTEKLQISRTKSCMYTMTPDEHFLVGKPCGSSRIHAVAGLSGHGFKMVPALGKIMADSVMGHKFDAYTSDFLNPSRFS